MRTITREEIAAACTSAVASHGADHSPYRGEQSEQDCRYVRNGQPECLIGVALHHLGVPLDTLRDMDACMDGSIDAIQALTVLGGAGFAFTPEALGFAVVAQAAQDARDSWGDSVARARTRSKPHDAHLAAHAHVALAEFNDQKEDA